MLKGVIAAVLALALPAVAYAGPISFQYAGTCAFGCGYIGLSDGDSVGGFITAASGFDADNVLDASEITDYGFTFGTFLVNPSTHSVAGGLALAGYVFADNLRFASYDKIFGFSITEVNTGSLVGLSGWLARVGIKLSGGPGDYSAQAVPEPGSLLLLGLGLLGLGLVWRSTSSKRESTPAG